MKKLTMTHFSEGGGQLDKKNHVIQGFLGESLGHYDTLFDDNTLKGYVIAHEDARSKKDKAAFTLAEVFSTHSAGYRKAAFTLAEVLITLGIIGVVAALTLPTLIQNYQEKATVTKVKKAYSIINNAYKLALNEFGSFDTWFEEKSTNVEDADGNAIWSPLAQDNSDLLFDKLSKYLNVTDRCKGSDTQCQKYTNIYNLQGGLTSTQKTATFPVMHLADGMTLYGGWIANPSDCKTNNNYCGDFSVDINGMKQGPNKYGQDIFFFYISAESIRPFGYENNPIGIKFSRFCNLNLTADNNGYACTAWILQNENMDYLHCSDLSWDGKTKCK